MGKIVTILYALPAIGLTLVLYAYAADVMLMSSYLATASIERKMRGGKVTVCKYKTSLIQVAIALLCYIIMSSLLIFDSAKGRFKHTFVSVI